MLSFSPSYRVPFSALTPPFSRQNALSKVGLWTDKVKNNLKKDKIEDSIVPKFLLVQNIFF